MSDTSELTDRDLCLIRLRFLDLLKSFFTSEPDAEKVSRWRGIFSALSKEQVTPQLDASIRRLAAKLDTKQLQELQEEFYTLLVDPYSDHLVNLNASYHLDGKSFGPSLVDYRNILVQARMIKNEDITEPEDNLVLMLDTFAALVEEEKQGQTQAAELQGKLLQHFLLPTGAQLQQHIASNEKADFYSLCIDFLCAYLELEAGLFEQTEPSELTA
jgi:TorA maturation chaperone TorD